MKSMTGYGSANYVRAGSEITVVVKSVNGRFFESRFHLPKEYFSSEAQLKKSLNETIHRGTVDVFVSRRGFSKVQIRINSLLASKWLQAHKDLSRRLKLNVKEWDLFDRLSSLPQVFELGDRGVVGQQELKALTVCFRKALAQCDRERQREGQSLRRHLIALLKNLKSLVAKMEKRRESTNRELENRLRERIRRIENESSVEPARLAQELVFYLDRSDISEEIVRLKEHIHMCENYVKGRGAKGKKLDFYSQELLREVNTIGSKANDAEMTENVVVAKGLIESLKEQVQNIE